AALRQALWKAATRERGNSKVRRAFLDRGILWIDATGWNAWGRRNRRHLPDRTRGRNAIGSAAQVQTDQRIVRELRFAGCCGRAKRCKPTPVYKRERANLWTAAHH